MPANRRTMINSLASIIAAPFMLPPVSVSANDDPISLKIDVLTPNYSELNEAFRQFSATVTATGFGRLSVTFAPMMQGAVGWRIDPLIRPASLQSVLCTPSLFDNFDPVFEVLGETSASFNSTVQQLTWLESMDGKNIVQEAYLQAELVIIGILPKPPLYLISRRPITDFNSLQGLRFYEPSGVLSTVLTALGGINTPPQNIGPDAFRAREVDSELCDPLAPHVPTYPDGRVYLLRHPLSMGVWIFAIDRRVYNAVGPTNMELLRIETERLSARLRVFIEQRTTLLLDRPIAGWTVHDDWPPLERTRLIYSVNSALDRWSERSVLARRCIASIRAAQRQFRLI